MTGKLVTLKFAPGKVVSWDDFVASHPQFSIALDGYVRGVTRFDETGPWLNINHHEDCDRAATRSSCKQVLNAVRVGLFETFRRCGRPHATVFCNDCDDDVMLSTYGLCHPTHVERKRFKEIVELEDLLDTVNGFYAVKKRWHLLKMLVWCMHPYAEARADGSLYGMDGDVMAHLIEQMHGRMKRTMYGRGREEEPDTRYDVIDRSEKFLVMREVGRYARYEVARQGYKAFLTVADGKDGTRRYVLGRQSPFIGWMPLSTIGKRLNEAEGCREDEEEKWGGSDLAIGSPRKGGSKLDLETVMQIVQEVRKEKESARKTYDSARCAGLEKY